MSEHPLVLHIGVDRVEPAPNPSYTGAIVHRTPLQWAIPFYREQNPNRIMYSGDSWEVWGEIGDSGPYHCGIPVPDDVTAMEYILDLIQAGYSLPTMVRQPNHDHNGTFAVVTDRYDYSKVIFRITC